ncbi:carboxylesterase/lipase family protein [Sphingomonas jatrophae]|uniref:Carboxylic ester hydrolase n=1 Tax=Sphingomonas jatrophae TaxID=1166337 RepID=A0A1I6KBQ5_9SPHN|nr:carboxylesterase family protein [Sphingomonas jatrophae]SFR88626.1 para-nitrobenzyl esterase [Sphingomonas jatrophae]
MIERRDFILGGLSAAACAARGQAAGIGGGDRPRVVTPSGPVIGRRADGLAVFKGIPFARPPVGPLRFRPPEPPVPWRSPLDAAAFGPIPWQPRIPMVDVPGTMAEDCLTLNVWAPVAKGPHPVVFSIYGGGNFLGAASQPGYDGAAFAKAGLLFVSCNYRLGAFGFAEFGTIDPAFAGSSLNGLLDIEAALRWVQGNIDAFGGDPERVTLLGLSAGAKNQATLAAMPSARGLFRRVTILSGGGETVDRTAAPGAAAARVLMDAAGVRDMAALVTLPAEQIVAAQGKAMAAAERGFPFRPVVDGRLLPMAPIDAARAGRMAGLEMVVGTTRDEAALAYPPALAATRAFVASQLAHLPLERMQALEARYAATFPALPLAERRIRQLTAEEYWIPALRLAEAHAASGGRTWMVRFDVPAAAGPFAGMAPHGSDSAFVYGGGADPLAARTHAMWADWARTGRPALDGGPAWPRYDLRTRETLILDAAPHIERDPRGDERTLWDGLL